MEIIPGLIVWVLLPAWVILGFLDWLCHRRSRIDVHCGPWESIFHLLLLALAGAGILMGLLLKLNEPILVLLGLCFVLHEAVVYVDVRYAHARRDISPVEQRIHDFMTAVPVSALCLIVVLHWDAVTNLLLQPSRILSEQIQLKSSPLPAAQVIGVVVAVLLGDVVPYFEELLRGARALRAKSTAQ